MTRENEKLLQLIVQLHQKVDRLEFLLSSTSYPGGKGETKVKNEKTGYLIANRNKEEMASKINSLIKDKKKLHEFAINAKKEAEKYRATFIIKKWQNIFK